jgi:Mg-chelatase subunit ChlD
MSEQLPPNHREELEAQVTALLMGELTDEEANAVRACMAQDPGLAKWHDRLKQTLPLVSESAATTASATSAPPAPLRLSGDRREQLLAHFKTARPVEFVWPQRPRISSWVVALAAVASVVFVAYLLLPHLARTRSMATFGTDGFLVNGRKEADRDARVLMEMAPLARPARPPAPAPTPAPQTAIILPPSESDEKSTPQVVDVTGQVAQSAIVLPPGQTDKDSDAYSLNAVGYMDVAKPSNAEKLNSAGYVNAGVPGNSSILSGPPVESGGGGGGGAGDATRSRGRSYRSRRGPSETLAKKENEVSPAFPRPQTTPTANTPAAMAPVAPSSEVAREMEGLFPQARAGTDRAQADRVTSLVAQSSAGLTGGTAMSTRQTRNINSQGNSVVPAAGDIQVDGAILDFAQLEAQQAAATVEAPASIPAPATAARKVNYGAIGVQGGTAPPDQAASTANYGDVGIEGGVVRRVKAASNPLTPQPEVPTLSNAFSTFSLNVSDVSFQLAAASLQNGVMPDVSSIRSEEFINAFDYRDPEPAAGAPIGFAWERADDPFAHNRNFLRFSVKTAAQGREAERPLNLVLLLDKSGSMERADRVEIIRQALTVLAGQLQEHDTLSVVLFARTAHLWADGVPGNQAGELAKKLGDITPEGGTNLEEAMKLAYETAFRHYLNNGENRVVLLTDGAANLGEVDPDAFKPWVETNRTQGVALDCFGIGWDGYNDTTLEALSRAGGGRYGFLNTPEEAATDFAGQLAGALRVAASDVKVQVEFNPNRVISHRQIGYANHQLTKEQFHDNTVAAAQIGAAESGNALYTVEVNAAGDGPLCTVRVRYRDPGTSDYHERAWEVPYTGSATPLDTATPAMRLAACAAEFSEALAESPYAGEVTFDKLLVYLNGIPPVYGADTRPQKLEWMVRQAKSISGK